MSEPTGYCRPITLEDIAASERERPREPQPPAPPMANVALAVEFTTGLDADRDFEFQGRTIRLRPTPYPTAIRLLAWMQQLERLEAMGELLGEHLVELRDCYVELATLAGTLVLDHAGPSPFLEAQPLDFHRIVSFSLDSGNEIPIHAPQSPGTTFRYDASFYLYRYFAHFGAVPGMVVLEQGRPQPASWRCFCAGMNHLRRAEAEAALQLFGAVACAQSGGDGAKEWVAAQTAEAGH